MGGNGSYSKAWGGVPDAQRSHKDTKFKIGGHKVLLQTDNYNQIKNILNSNSANAIYLIAKANNDGFIKVESINVFEGHNLSYEINLVFDSNGNIVPFSEGKGTHAHKWSMNEKTGTLGRKSHDRKNLHLVDKKFDSLMSKIVKFNQDNNKYNETGKKKS